MRLSTVIIIASTNMGLPVFWRYRRLTYKRLEPREPALGFSRGEGLSARISPRDLPGVLP